MLFANNANTTLASSLTTGATSMSVTSATNFPSPTGVQYFYCTLADAATQTTIEIVKVTSVSGTTFAITRAQDGTSATAFAAGAVVSLRLVRASLNDFPKLDEINTFNADQSISGQLTTSAGLATTGTFTATAPSDGLVMDYATGFGRFSAFAGDGFQWYNAGIANTKLMQLSSTGVITTATWNGATVTVPYGGTGLTSLTASYIPYGNGTGAFSSSSNLQFNGTNSLAIGGSFPTTVSNGIAVNNSSGTYPGYEIQIGGVTQFYINATNGAAYLATTGANPMVFYTNGAERMRLDSGGYLTLGATSQISASKVWTQGDFVNTMNGYGANSTATTGKATFAYFLYNNTGVGTITSTGTTCLYNSISDERLKENIVDAGSGLAKLSGVKVRSFDWISTKEKVDFGLIAQEVNEVAPEIVAIGKDKEDGTIDTPWQLDSSALVPAMIKAIQELNEKFDAYVASHS